MCLSFPIQELCLAFEKCREHFLISADNLCMHFEGITVALTVMTFRDLVRLEM